MSINKNPYEVRLDVLKMAQEMLDREQDLAMQKFNQKLETFRADKMPANLINSFIDEQTPKMYDPNEVVTRSQALYSFVTNTDKHKS